MSERQTSLHGVMEAKGAYNRHATIPVGGAALALPFLEGAARRVALEGQDDPVVIADYGSSQGKNSLAPMAVAPRYAWPPLPTWWISTTAHRHS